MTYSLINKCAKNYYNRTFIVPVIAKNVVTCFFLRHSVHSQQLVVCFVGQMMARQSTIYDCSGVAKGGGQGAQAPNPPDKT